jgi:SAM-dependent methyltransferase
VTGGVDNRAVFDSAAVVASYDTGPYELTPCEKALVERYVPAGCRVLDAGVGTGRTTPALVARAGRYVGFDVAPAMIDAARVRFPGVDLRVADATRLDGFDDCSFDAVVFSYNGLDYLEPYERRAAALRELRRVLAPTGVLLFSTHNPRAVVRLPRARSGRALAVAGYETLRAMASLVTTAPFRHGAGYAIDAGKPLLTYYATPVAVGREVARCGFELLEVRNGDAPRRGRSLVTPWYYYACRRAS